MLIVKSESLDIYRNLAVEEYLLEQVLDEGPILYLWRSVPAVVFGKNQNPWRECRLRLMAEEGVFAARRQSGGGTVYHDEGNLNYCIITDRDSYEEAKAFEVIVRALAECGVEVVRSGQSNLCVGDRKFSGNAFCFKRGRVMHHGTLLVQADLARLGRYLGPELEGIETHAIRSVPALVGNLADLGRGLCMDRVSRAVEASFRTLYADSSVRMMMLEELDAVKLAQLESRQRSAEWVYGATPRFEVEVEGVRLEVVKGQVVQQAGVFSSGISLLGGCFDISAFSF
jgi:lipoate---protein ligase